MKIEPSQIQHEIARVVGDDGYLPLRAAFRQGPRRQGPFGLLAEKGFAVARRTVTKYRELLGIPKRSERRLVSSGVLQWFLREYMTGISALPPCNVG